MKRVALFMPTLGGGGAERVMIQIAGNLAGEGMTVALVVASCVGVLQSEVPSSIELVDLKAGRVMKAVQPLAAWLTEWQPDVLMACQAHANIVAYFARRQSGGACRLIVREVSTPSVNMKSVGLAMRMLLWPLMRWAYMHADAVIAVSQGVADDLRRYLRADLPRLRVIYNPVIDDQLYIKAEQAIDHPWFGPTKSVPVVLAVGRLTEAKNYELLIRAFSQVAKAQQVRLLILGEGEDRSKLQKLVQDMQLEQCVAMPGFDANPYRYMKRCAVYVMSSRWEGLPGALIQALALGATIVSTDCPSGPYEILAGGAFGFLIPSCDELALSVAIEKALLGDFVGLGHDEQKKDHLSQFSADVIKKSYQRLVLSND